MLWWAQWWTQRPSTRCIAVLCFTFGAVWFWVAGFNEFLIESIFGFAVTTLLWPFVMAPYLAYTLISQPLHINWQVADSDVEISADLLKELTELGFKPVGTLARNPVTLVAARLSMFMHPETGDTVRVSSITTQMETSDLLVFQTRFEGGFTIQTCCSRTAGMSPPDPMSPIVRFPQVIEVSDLYQLHRKIKERTARRALAWDRETEVAKFISESAETHQKHVSRAVFKLSTKRDRYVYTIRGATHDAWLNMWPVRWIREKTIERSALRLARDLGFDIGSGRLVPCRSSRRCT